MGNCPSVIIKDLDKPEEACGVFGVVAPGKNVSKIAYYALLTLQHRGQESAGIAAFDFNHFSVYKDMGLVNQVFNDNILSKLPGQIAVGHTRYSTMGDSNINNAQPFVVNTDYGVLTLAHNGNIVNALDLKNELLRNGIDLHTSSDSEIITNLIANNINRGYTLEEAIMFTLPKCIGAYSLVIAMNDKLAAVRDPFGIRPLCVGSTKDNDIIVTSETCALDISNARFIREINPGEVLIIDLNKNMRSYSFTTEAKNNLCLFELIYFARPDSIMNGNSIYNYRFNLGRELAKVEPVEADYVIPVPDSGTCAAIGYAYESNIPLAKGLIKNRNIGRTFIQPTPEVRELGIKLKLNPIADVIYGKRLVVVDDSIVRGTTSRKIVEMLKAIGAEEVHLRISSAPVKYPCFYGIDTDSSSQLIASQNNDLEICNIVEADTLKYLNVETMIKTCAINKVNDFCSACFTGLYPIKVDNLNRVNKMILEK